MYGLLLLVAFANIFVKFPVFAVNDLPHFILPEHQMPPYVIVAEGSDVELLCTAGGRQKLHINWYRYGDPLKHGQKRSDDKHFRLVQWELQIRDADISDSGMYRCEVTNELGKIFHDYIVKVVERKITKPILHPELPRNVTAILSTNATFECEILSDPSGVKIEWVYHKTRNSDVYFLRDGVMGVIINPDTSNSLVITDLSYSHQGWYTCLATNSLGASFQSAYLRVLQELPSGGHNHESGSCGMTVFYMSAVFIVTAILAIVAFVGAKVYKEKKRQIHILAHQVEPHPAFMYSTRKSSTIKQDSNTGTITLLVTIRRTGTTSRHSNSPYCSQVISANATASALQQCDTSKLASRKRYSNYSADATEFEVVAV